MGDIVTLKQDEDVFSALKTPNWLLMKLYLVTIGSNFSAFPTILYYLEMCFPW